VSDPSDELSRDADGPAPESTAADQRLANALESGDNKADLRRQLQGENSDEAEDLLSRLNALDFVQQAVGATGEMPELIGVYEIKGVLGRGGMGVVYLGWQKDLEREVALKVLSQHYTADPTMRKRFRAEARATAALHHRHIVPIYDYGEASGMLFFAMERVNGLSLDKHIAAARRAKAKPMEFLDAARRFAGVADALGLAHRRRLLHRDVKPGNILVAEDETLALTDFGLAKALDHASMQLTSKGGGFLGTLHYASPEQAMGRELTAASDLYSLGVTIFEAVTGHLPLAGKTTEALLQSIMYGTPSRLRDYVPKPPRDLEAVLDKLLSREVDDRYQDGEDLARDLLRIADGEPVQIRRLPLHVRVWRRARKNPVLSGALSAVFVLILATMTLVGVLSRERGKGRVSRHQETLNSIAKEVSREQGPAYGPQPLFEVLTGHAVDAQSPNTEIISKLSSAQESLPTDMQVEKMRSAYVDDYAPDATNYLQEGRGYDALLIYDRKIAEAITAQASGDLAVNLALYQLYLSRGVAKLTSAVSRANDARTDLALASFLRPGARFPLLLLDVIDVVQSSDFGASIARLKKKLDGAGDEYTRACGMLLWAAARQLPLSSSNLMVFSLDYDRRRRVHEFAADLLPDEVMDCVTHGQPTGLAIRYSNACREALDSLAKPAALRDLAERVGEEIGMRVHPESELHVWRQLLGLLLQPTPRPSDLSPTEQGVTPSLQLGAWRGFVSLKPRSELAALWIERFEEFHGNHQGLRGIVEVAAGMHLLAGSKEAQKWANQWVVEAEGDPAARLCRMQVMLGLGRIREATDDAIVAVQNSVDRSRTLKFVLATIYEAAEKAEPKNATGLRLMAKQFDSIGGATSPGLREGR
jgi:serine/threonine protein kinase